jgi:hypothetical protein
MTLSRGVTAYHRVCKVNSAIAIAVADVLTLIVPPRHGLQYNLRRSEFPEQML